MFPPRPGIAARVVLRTRGDGTAVVAVSSLTAAAEHALPAFGLRVMPEGAGGTQRRVAGPPWAFAAAAAREGPAQEAARAASEAISLYDRETFTLGGKRALELTSPVVMAIVNVTPDSFSDGGTFASAEAAATFAANQVALGAAIVDVGGESTRPGASPVKTSEELARTIPVIEDLLSRHPAAYVSIDTVKPEVADAALRAGASMVNDVTGLARTPELAAVASQHGAALLLGHCRGTPDTMASLAHYGDVVADVHSELASSVDRARDAGIPADRIVVDPGLGFSKTAPHNWEILRRLGELRSLGFPIAVGASRKSFLGSILADRPPKDRDVATAAVSLVAMLAGAKILRVHDVRGTRDALAVGNALTGGHPSSAPLSSSTSH